MRQSDWEDRLAAAIAKHQALPSEYGVSDCFLIADDGVEACMGKRMTELAGQAPLGSYESEAGATKRMRERGFTSVEEVFAAVFTDVPILLAQRGDLGVIEREGQRIGGVFTAIGFFTRFQSGPVFLPVDQVVRAFKVE